MAESIFSDAPSTPNSGPPLPEKCMIQHRSEILFRDQIENVKNTQGCLKNMLEDIGRCGDEVRLAELYRSADVLKQITDEEVIKLQVTKKINEELRVARYDLDHSLRGKGNLRACRKRVMWLEARIEYIMGRQRIQNDPSANVAYTPTLHHYPGVLDGRTISTSSSAALSSQERCYGLKQAGADTGVMLDSHCTQLSGQYVEGSVTAVSGSGSGRISGRRGYDETPEIHHIQDNLRETQQEVVGNGMKDVSGCHLGSDGNDSVGSAHSGEGVSVNNSADCHAAGETNDTLLSFKHQQCGKTDSALMAEMIEANPISDDINEPAMRVHSAPARRNVTMNELEDGGGEKHALDALQQRPATHVVSISSSNRKSVSVWSPKSKEVTDLGSLREEMACVPVVAERDKALDYWNSEHHRLEFCASSQLICDVDPLSYHQMGIAVPGSFLLTNRDLPKPLPWRDTQTDKTYEIHDIHKIALDRLSGRIQEISDKMVDAVEASTSMTGKMRAVAPSEETSIIQTLSRSRESQDSGTIMDIKLPKLESRRLGTSGSGRVVFYPNPIPQPKTLPITRVNRSKVYPRSPHTFCDVTSKDRATVVRVADQHQLYDETKLSLYHDKHEPRSDGIQSTELRLRCLLNVERQSGKTCSSVSTHLSSVTTPGSYPVKRYLRQRTKAHFTALRAIANLKENNWKTLKPRSNTLDHSGLKWERVKTVVHVNLVSERVEERRDAARHLGLLQCGDAMVFFALKQRLAVDIDALVRLEASKSLVLLGCWEEEVLYKVVQFLIYSNSTVQSDLITTMMEGRNIQYVNKTTAVFGDLVKVLSHFSCKHGLHDEISFHAAVLIGKLCVVDENAKTRLMRALHTSSDTHVKAKALEILVKYMNCTEWSMVTHIFDQLHCSPVWKYRALAAKLLILLGTENVCVDNQELYVYQQLEKQLWDDPITAVRLSVAKAITALNMLQRATERVDKKLEDPDEDARAQAVITLGTLGMRNEKVVRSLLEMLELDSSEYVRLMILRTFATLELCDRRVIRVLQDKQKLEGSLAKEARRTLRILTSLPTTPATCH